MEAIIPESRTWFAFMEDPSGVELRDQNWSRPRLLFRSLSLVVASWLPPPNLSQQTGSVTRTDAYGSPTAPRFVDLSSGSKWRRHGSTNGASVIGDLNSSVALGR